MADEAATDSGVSPRRPWLRLWIAFAPLAFFVFFYGVGMRGQFGAVGVPMPAWTAALATALAWYAIARREAWKNGIPNLWSALLATAIVIVVATALEGGLILVFEPVKLTSWWGQSVAFAILVEGLVAPIACLIGGAWSRWLVRGGRPWPRLLGAYLAIVIIGHLTFSAFNWITTGSLPDSAAVVRIAVIAIVMLPVFGFIAGRHSWKRGIPDYWAAAIAAGSVNAGGVTILILAFSNELSRTDGYFDFVFQSLVTLAGGSLLGGLAAYAIARTVKQRSSATVVDIEALPRYSLADRNTASRDLTVAVRVRERLDVINTLIGSTYALMLFFLALFVGLSVISAELQSRGQEAWMSVDTNVAGFRELSVRAGATLLGMVLLSPILYFLSHIHRRVLASLGALTCMSVLVYAGWRLMRFWLHAVPSEAAGVRHELTIFMGIGITPTIVVYGALSISFIGLAFATPDDFLAGRGARPSWRQLLSAGRRLFGMPAYVGALGKAQIGVTSLFLASAIVSAGFLTGALFISMPLYLPSTQAVSFPAAVEYQIGYARAVCGDYGVTRPRDYAAPPDATMPALAPLDRCVIDELNPQFYLVPFLLWAMFGAFALFGLVFGRAAQRAATRSYQRVREWDDRAPIVYLRSFRSDQVHVPARPHGILPRLVARPATARTLDEIVLDVASSYGPVIAVGQPDEELPPLGAARIYPSSNDWRSVVTALCDAAQVVIICMDATEGVNWELDQILGRGQEHKTVILLSSQLSQTERRQLAERIFGTPTTSDPIGGYSDSQGNVLVTARAASRAAYRVALNLGLAQITSQARA